MTIKSIIKEDIQYEKSERTELTTSKIIDAAINEFGKNGYLGGTVNNICNTGINKGLLYHNFKGKDDLYLTCLNFSCQKLLNYLKEQDRTENLENYMSARMNFFSNNPNRNIEIRDKFRRISKIYLVVFWDIHFFFLLL